MKDDDLLDRVKVAAPCPADWASMDGDERIRFCGQCKLNVYNISEMSSKEASELIRTSEGRLCVRLYRRKDGTVITDNCPVGLRKLRNKMRKLAVACTVMFTWFGMPERAVAQGAIDPVKPGATQSQAQPEMGEAQAQLGDLRVDPNSHNDEQPPTSIKGVNTCSKKVVVYNCGGDEPIRIATIVASVLGALGLGAFFLWRRKRASLWMLGSLAAVVLMIAGMAWGLL